MGTAQDGGTPPEVLHKHALTEGGTGLDTGGSADRYSWPPTEPPRSPAPPAGDEHHSLQPAVLTRADRIPVGGSQLLPGCRSRPAPALEAATKEGRPPPHGALARPIGSGGTDAPDCLTDSLPEEDAVDGPA